MTLARDFQWFTSYNQGGPFHRCEKECTEVQMNLQSEVIISYLQLINSVPAISLERD